MKWKLSLQNLSGFEPMTAKILNFQMTSLKFSSHTDTPKLTIEILQLLFVESCNKYYDFFSYSNNKLKDILRLSLFEL
jgi:hypothetical protein